MTRARVPIAACAVAALLGWMVPAPAWGQAEDVAAQQHEVQDRLVLERAALATLKDQQSSVLELIDFVEQRARVTEKRAAALQRELDGLRRHRARAERQEALSRQWMQAQLAELSPRLRAMYRVQRHSRLDVLLSARDFSSLVWRTRALSTLVERDMQMLRETQLAVAFQQESHRMLERVEASVRLRSAQLSAEQAQSLRQQELLGELLRQIAGDTSHAKRLVRELEAAERRLSRLVDAFESEVDVSPFAQLRGDLRWPTNGMIEVGFGKVVNPRFNTETFQKGLDLRAPAGSPVVAVAPGKVVFAGWLRGYGNLLIVDHGSGYHSLVAHLSGFSRAVGDAVETGELLGRVGDTGSLKGAYLYFEIRKNGVAIDPADWLGAPE